MILPMQKKWQENFQRCASEFVKAMVQSAERTSYQPNPIYERQANEIESISKTISEQSRTIKSLQEERDKLGIFKGREKKELQNKIDNFERLRRSNLDKLGALGVSEPSKADEAVKEKRSMAAQEQNRAKAAMQNRGAKERAEEVKAAFLEAAEAAYRQTNGRKYLTVWDSRKKFQPWDDCSITKPKPKHAASLTLH